MPAGHEDAHTEDPGGEHVLAAQAVQAVLADQAEYWPAEQIEQTALLVLENAVPK